MAIMSGELVGSNEFAFVDALKLVTTSLIVRIIAFLIMISHLENSNYDNMATTTPTSKGIVAILRSAVQTLY